RVHRVPGQIRGCLRTAEPTRSIRPYHAQFSTRGVRPGSRRAREFKGVRKGHDHDGPYVSNGVAFDFSNTSALVTGGTSGIGLAVASAFSEAGASVTITGTKPSAGDYEVDLTRFAYRQLQMRDPQSVDELSE